MSRSIRSRIPSNTLARVVVWSVAGLLVWPLAGCRSGGDVTVSRIEPRVGGAAPNQTPWLGADSPFPDPKEPSARKAPESMTSASSDSSAQGDAGLPKLPDGMTVPRLPKATAADPEVPREPPPGDGPVALVRGVELSRRDFDAMVTRGLESYYGMAHSLPRSVWEKIVGQSAIKLVRRLVDQQLAEQLHVTVTEAQLDEEFRRFVEDRGGERLFPKLLEHLHLTEDEIRRDLYARLLHEAVLAAALADLRVTDDEVERYYHSHPELYRRPAARHLRHVFVQTPSQDPDVVRAARERIEQAKAALDAGQGFEEVAARYSDGGTRAEGGDLGWLHVGQMPREFDAVAFSLEPGQVSGIVRTDLGFHIIQCLGTRPGGVLPLDDHLMAEIRSKLLRGRRQVARQELVADWYGDDQVEYLDPVVEAAVRKVQASRPSMRRAPRGHATLGSPTGGHTMDDVRGTMSTPLDVDLRIRVDGSRVLAEITFRNESDEPYHLVGYVSGQGKEITNSLFVIQCRGERLRYIGKRVKRGAPTREDYVVIPPHGRLVSVVELGALYDLGGHGGVRCEARYSAINPELDGHGLTTLESNAAEFVVPASEGPGTTP